MAALLGEDLKHLALSIYITSFHKKSMDHSGGPASAVSGKAIGCRGIFAFHISPQTAVASRGLTHSRL